MKTAFDLSKNTIIFYHENCADGFTSSYVAYKKFKNKAEYIPLSHSDDKKKILKNIKIKDLKDKEIYFIDFCLDVDSMKEIEKVAKKLVVLDHHIGSKSTLDSLKETVYGEGFSGAYLAQEYFFPKNKMPNLIKYVSIGDTYTWSKDEKKKKEEEAILAYIHNLDFDFKIFNKIEKDLEDKNKFLEIKKIGETLKSAFTRLVENNLDSAKLIEFDGYKVYAVNASRSFRSELGHILAEKTKSFSIVYGFDKDGLKLSFRGAGKVDLSELTKKYGGGGHFNASAIKTSDKKFIEEFVRKIMD